MSPPVVLKLFHEAFLRIILGDDLNDPPCEYSQHPQPKSIILPQYSLLGATVTNHIDVSSLISISISWEQCLRSYIRVGKGLISDSRCNRVRDLRIIWCQGINNLIVSLQQLCIDQEHLGVHVPIH